MLNPKKSKKIEGLKTKIKKLQQELDRLLFDDYLDRNDEQYNKEALRRCPLAPFEIATIQQNIDKEQQELLEKELKEQWRGTKTLKMLEEALFDN